MGPCQALTKHVGSRLEIVAWTVDGGDVDCKKQGNYVYSRFCLKKIYIGFASTRGGCSREQI